MVIVMPCHPLRVNLGNLHIYYATAQLLVRLFVKGTLGCQSGHIVFAKRRHVFLLGELFRLFKSD